MKNKSTTISTILLCVFISLKTYAATFTVSNLNDAGAGSLRQAITSANSNSNPATLDIIQFSISGTITLASDLPVISEKVDIQGQTATSAVAGTPTFTINCNGFKAIDITAGNSIVNTLCIVNGTNDPGITLRTNNSNVVKGCFIGITTTGTSSANKTGININSSQKNLIGGTTAAERNIISGNANDGIKIDGTSSTGNKITGNYIGVKTDGATALGNGNDGILIKLGSGNCGTDTIGGTTSGTANIISANAKRGIEIVDCTDILIQGNYIGTNSAFQNLGNGGSNVFINGTSSNIIVGAKTNSPSASEANVIAYAKNNEDGVHLNALNTKFIPVRGNIVFCNSGESVKLASGSNGGIAKPTSSGLPSSDANTAKGTCVAGSTVHVYQNNSAVTLSCKCEGEVYIGSTTCTAGGTWTLAHGKGLSNSQIEAVTAAQTDASNNTSSYSTCNAYIALPIKLISFSASGIESNSVRIEWITALENNTDHYEIQRSTDGLNWDLLETASIEKNKHYSTIDGQPKSGYNYYRLIEVETSGKKNIYAVDVVKIVLNDVHFQIYPNPSSGLVTFDIDDIYPHYEVEILNLSGQIVNKFKLTSGKTNLFVSNIPGIYLAKVKINGKFKVQKMIIN